MGHRGGYNGAATGVFPPPQPDATPLDPSLFRGFSYLVQGDAARRSTLGADPARAQAVLQALYDLVPGGVADDNPAMPSGYTYLLQFVAHDLVDTAMPLWAAAAAGLPSRNMRDAALLLDALYGGGPSVCPLAFAPAGGLPDYSTRLRLGVIADAAAQNLAGACPMRDIARLALDAVPAEAGNGGDAAVVFLADERNADNAIVSQITALFAILHNGITAKLAGALGPQACFTHASTALLTMYYSVIGQDLLRRLLHPDVHAVLSVRGADSPDWLWDGGRIPLEFTHGAFRIGHAMVRPSYQLNGSVANTFGIRDILAGPGGVTDLVPAPLPASWIVTWSRFFDTLGATPNRAKKLGIRQQMPLDFNALFDPPAANSPAGLTVRDWLSAAAARFWPLDVLIPALTRHYPASLPALTPARIGAWIDACVQSAPGTASAATVAAARAQLSTELPLPLYVVLEAEQDPANGGTHLGPIGSIIVGEVLWRLIGQRTAGLAAQMPLARQALGADWGKIEAVASMPDLVRLAAEWGSLSGCDTLPFIA
jgi:hypothetical protein